MNETPPAYFILFEGTEAVGRVRPFHEPTLRPRRRSRSRPRLADIVSGTTTSTRTIWGMVPMHARKRMEALREQERGAPARRGEACPECADLEIGAPIPQFMVPMRATDRVEAFHEPERRPPARFVLGAYHPPRRAGGRRSWPPRFTNSAGHFPSRQARGFTLLEVLIATAVFAIVLAAASTVFYGALHLRNGATEAVELALPRQQALAVIQRDLANLVVPGGPLSGVLQTTSITNVVGGQSSPDFYTSTGFIDPTSPWGEIQRVSYVLTEPTDREAAGRDLIRAVTRNLLPATVVEEPTRQWLMGGVQGLTFYYYDGTQWRDSWDSTTADPTSGLTNNLPHAIKVQIQLATRPGERAGPVAAPIELVVPIVVQARTNKTQQATGGAQ